MRSPRRLDRSYLTDLERSAQEDRSRERQDRRRRRSEVYRPPPPVARPAAPFHVDGTPGRTREDRRRHFAPWLDYMGDLVASEPNRSSRRYRDVEETQLSFGRDDGENQNVDPVLNRDSIPEESERLFRNYASVYTNQRFRRDHARYTELQERGERGEPHEFDLEVQEIERVEDQNNPDPDAFRELRHNNYSM